MKRLYLILPLLFEAISEGLELRGITIFKVIGKQVEILELASWFLVIWIYGNDVLKTHTNGLKLFTKYVLVYLLLRFIVFNYVHNLAAGLPLNYLGTVSFIDRILALVSFGQWWFIIIWQTVAGYFVYAIIRHKL